MIPRPAKGYKAIRYGAFGPRGDKLQSPLEIAKAILTGALRDYPEVPDDRKQLYENRVLTMDEARFMHMPTLAAVFGYMDAVIFPKQGPISFSSQTEIKIDLPIMNSYISRIPETVKPKAGKKNRQLSIEAIESGYRATFVRYMYHIISSDQIEKPPPLQIFETPIPYEPEDYEPREDEDEIELEENELEGQENLEPDLEEEENPNEPAIYDGTEQDWPQPQDSGIYLPPGPSS